MYRGTTPTIRYTLEFDATNATKLNIAFAQGSQIIIEKGLSDATIAATQSGSTITINLTEADTLALRSSPQGVDMQIRMELSGKKLASGVIHTTVGRILKDGVL